MGKLLTQVQAQSRVAVGIGLEEVIKTDTMSDKEQDPNLQAPQEANTTKHINFLEAEEAASTGGNADDGDDNNDESPTKKVWQELRKDQNQQENNNPG